MISDDILSRLAQTLEESNKRTIEEANRQQTEEIKQHIKLEINEVKEKFEEELNRKVTEFDNKYKQLQLKYIKLEKDLKKNNLIIFGLESSTENLAENVIIALNQHLGLTLEPNDIDNVFTIGKLKSKKPVILKLVSYLKKREILINSKKLKGTNISVAEDLTADELKDNKILRLHLKEARSKNLRAFIKNNKLTINGHTYTAKELTDEKEDTDAEETAENEYDNDVLKEAKNCASRSNNSAPATPTALRQAAQIEQEEEQVFETEKAEDPKKRKIVKASQPANKVLRSFSRANSNREIKNT